MRGGREASETEREGSERDGSVKCRARGGRVGWGVAASAPRLAPRPAASPPAVEQGTLVPQILERQLRPGEVSLDELERAFRETATEIAPPLAPAPRPAPKPKQNAAPPTEAKMAEKKTAVDPAAAENSIA